MILLIDNYDSFTYNLWQYLSALGSEVEVRRNNQVTLEQIEKLLPRAIVISPGPGVPEKAGISIDLIKRFSGEIPILGVCLGHQAIGYAFGGRIVRAPAILHGKTSYVFHDARSIFDQLPNPFEATRYHSLVIDSDCFPEAELEISARTADGVIMGVRHRQYLIEGVQFHPESVLTRVGKKILSNFLAQVA